MSGRQIFIYLLVVLSTFWCSCNKTQNCLPQNNKCRINFVVFNDYQQIEPYSIDSLSVYVIEPTYKAIYEAVSQLSTCELPLSHKASQIKIALQCNGIWDSIQIQYHLQKQFQNTECGFNISYHLQSTAHTQHLLQDIHIKNPTIDENKNLNLYFVFGRDK